MIIEEKYMRRALQLAKNGIENTSPNPMVGAVIVHDGKIIGEGYHRKHGEGHAEVNAIASVKDKALLQQSTIYVTLEPCSHYGKTPPCAQLIIDSKIPNVVIGCLDPFEKVSGRGVKMLQDAGIYVATRVLEQECKNLNPHFITAHSLRRPFVTLKWAQSQDEYMDIIRNNDEPPAKFSTEITSMLVHKLRAQHDAIIAGSETIIRDNPRLNNRMWSGQNPIIVIADRRSRIHADAQVFKHNPIYLSSREREDIKHNIQWIKINKTASINDYLSNLYNAGITSLLVEGGSSLLQAFINSGLWDVARIETNPNQLNKRGDKKAPIIDYAPTSEAHVDGNKISIYLNKL